MADKRRKMKKPETFVLRFLSIYICYEANLIRRPDSYSFSTIRFQFSMVVSLCFAFLFNPALGYFPF
jgi:hypothetical protein